MTHIPKLEKHQVTQQLVRDLLDYSPDRGRLVWRRTVNSRAVAGSIAGGGSVTWGYLSMSIGGRIYRQHHVVWLHHTGAWPSHEIDHINGDRSDNRIENLRDVTRTINSQNERKARSHSSTGLIGAKRKRGKFAAEIRVNGKKTWIGAFDTAEEASAAYIKAKRQLHAGCSI